MDREPAVVTAAITAVVGAVIALLIAFGLDLSDDQQKAILGFVVVVAPLVAGFVTRAKVTPMANLLNDGGPGMDAGGE